MERDLSCPDIHSLPNLAAILGISVDDLMQIKKKKFLFPSKSQRK